MTKISKEHRKRQYTEKQKEKDIGLAQHLNYSIFKKDTKFLKGVFTS